MSGAGLRVARHAGGRPRGRLTAALAMLVPESPAVAMTGASPRLRQARRPTPMPTDSSNGDSDRESGARRGRRGRTTRPEPVEGSTASEGPRLEPEAAAAG